MGVTFVMTSNKILFFLLFFFVSTSCETINEITGLGGKPDIDDSLAMETLTLFYLQTLVMSLENQ